MNEALQVALAAIDRHFVSSDPREVITASMVSAAEWGALRAAADALAAQPAADLVAREREYWLERMRDVWNDHGKFGVSLKTWLGLGDDEFHRWITTGQAAAQPARAGGDAPSPLILPIVHGKCYQRRDGSVVVARRPHEIYDPQRFAYAGHGLEAEKRADLTVSLATGRVVDGDYPDARDLIAGPLGVAYATTAAPQPTAAEPAASTVPATSDDARDQGFIEGTIAALAVIRAHDSQVIWEEVLQAAGKPSVLQHAAHVEPEDWTWAGFDRYVKTKPERAHGIGSSKESGDAA